jgi:hypothetical protein
MIWAIRLQLMESTQTRITGSGHPFSQQLHMTILV